MPGWLLTQENLYDSVIQTENVLSKRGQKLRDQNVLPCIAEFQNLTLISIQESGGEV